MESGGSFVNPKSRWSCHWYFEWRLNHLRRNTMRSIEDQTHELGDLLWTGDYAENREFQGTDISSRLHGFSVILFLPATKTPPPESWFLPHDCCHSFPLSSCESWLLASGTLFNTIYKIGEPKAMAKGHFHRFWKVSMHRYAQLAKGGTICTCPAS